MNSSVRRKDYNSGNVQMSATIRIGNETYGLGFEHRFPYESEAMFDEKLRLLMKAVKVTVKERGIMVASPLLFPSTRPPSQGERNMGVTEETVGLGDEASGLAETLADQLTNDEPTEAKATLGKLQNKLNEIKAALDEVPESADVGDEG